MSEVLLHVYDVTNSLSVKTNNTILNINKFFKDGIGVGGIFHGAVQVYGEEWSFGFCEVGSGVFSCHPKENPMYTYRETVSLGFTGLSPISVKQILTDLADEWPGNTYDLLSRNCNHFCEVLCERLGVQKLPGWVNRFANAGDAAFEAAGNTMEKLKQAKIEIASAGNKAFRYLFGNASASSVSPDPGLLSDSTTPKNSVRGLISRVTSKGSSSSSSDTEVTETMIGQSASEEGGITRFFKFKKEDNTAGENSLLQVFKFKKEVKEVQVSGSHLTGLLEPKEEAYERLSLPPMQVSVVHIGCRDRI